MSNHSKALAFINRLVEKFGNGGYIFRGTTTRYSLQKGEGGIRDGINSTLYRWVVKENKEGDISKQQENLKKIFAENEHFYPADMEKEIVENASKMFPSNTAAHEILTDLQHFGGKTNMMDFTRNMYVALFFACKGKLGKNGELLALNEKGKELKKINKIDYASFPQKGKIEIINPAGAQVSRQRVHFQGSIFVRPTKGYINRELCNITKIPAQLKEPILEYLRTFHNITVDTIYNDLYGFINDEKNNETPSLYLYLGLASYKEREYERAIKHYNECLKVNPQMSLAYYHRGRARFDMKKYEIALADFDLAIYYQKNNIDAYFYRGNARIRCGMPVLAAEDYEHVVRHNDQHAEAYYRLGKAYTDSGVYPYAVQSFESAIYHQYDFAKACNARGVAFLKWYEKEIPLENERKKTGTKTSEKDKRLVALKNFDMAIEYNPNYTDAYWNRSMAHESLGNKEEATKDQVRYLELRKKSEKNSTSAFF